MLRSGYCVLACAHVCSAQDAVLHDYKRGVTYSDRELLQWLQATQRMAVHTSLLRGDKDTLQDIKVRVLSLQPLRTGACHGLLRGRAV